MGVPIPLLPLQTGGVGVDVLQFPGHIAAGPALTSAHAAIIPAETLLDFGAVAMSTAACAKGSCASGSPNCMAVSTQDFTMEMACG